MAQTTCKLCLRSVKAPDWEEHTLRPEHTQNLPSEIIVKQFVSKKQIKEAYNYFIKFGEIESKEIVPLDTNSFMVRYKYRDKAVHSKIIHQQHALFTRKLEITWPGKKVPYRHIPELSEENLAIINSLKAAPTFLEQVTILENKLQVDPKEIKKKQVIIENDLKSAVVLVFPKNEIIFINSLNLFVQARSFDIFVTLEKKLALLKKPNSLRKELMKSKKFSNIRQNHYLGAISCTHEQTKIYCLIYINAKGNIVNHTNKLIEYYLSLDEKIILFFTLILFWADVYNLNQTNFICNYAFQLMMIFYLQQDPYKLPAVMDLQKDVSVMTVDGWNHSFTPIEHENSKLQNASLTDMVSGFFRFYTNFDYFLYVISPYCGSAIEKTKFVKPSDLPEYFDQLCAEKKSLWVDTSLCVQDPFDHSANVTTSASKEYISKFFCLCREASHCMVKFGESKFLNKLFTYGYSDALQFTIENDTGLNKDEWAQLVKTVVVKVPTRVLACTVTESSSNKTDHFSYICEGQYYVWSKRSTGLKKIMHFLPPNTSEMDKEILTTASVQKNNNNKTTKMKIQLNFKREPCRMEVLIETNSRIVCDFMRLKLRRFLAGEYERSRREVKENTQKNFPSSSTVLVDVPKIVDTTEKGQTFTKQVFTLLKTLQIDDSLLEKNLKTIKHDVTLALNPEVAQNKIHFFGSSVSGLWLKDSNLDVYIETETESLKVTIKSLIVNSVNFDNVKLEWEGIPFITCRHIKTKVICRLTTQNRLLVANTNLIKYYTTLDEKIRSLMIAIKFWNIFNNSFRKGRFSSYAMYLMIIFYLQQVYELPSVMKLQKDPSPDLVNNWNCVFTPVDFSNEKLKNATIFDLLKGFFNFFVSFDYTSYVISPYLGYALEKVKFLKPFDLPNSYNLYLKQNNPLYVDSGLCIQDPFEHSRNVATHLTLGCSGRFISSCQKALHLMTNGEILYKVLCDKSSPEIREFCLFKNNETDEKQWTESIKKLTWETATQILGCTVKMEGKKGPTVFRCQGYYKIFEDREKILKKLLPKLSGCSEKDKEAAVTARIKESYPKNVINTKKPLWSLVIELLFNREPYRAVFVVKGLNKHSGDSHVVHFLRIKLMEFLEIVEKEEKQEDTGDAKGKEASKDMGIIEKTMLSECSRGGQDEEPSRAVETVAETVLSECSGQAKGEEPSPDVEIMLSDCSRAVEDEERSQDEGRTRENDGKETISEDEKAYSDIYGDLLCDKPPATETKKDDEMDIVLIEDDDDLFFVDLNPNEADHPQAKAASVTQDPEETNSSAPPEHRKSKSEEGEITQDDEDDDVPSDFFDDFSDEDFLDGLDIVDACDDACKKKSDSKIDEKPKKPRPSKEKKHHRKRSRSKSPKKRSRSPMKRSKSPKKRSMSPKKRSKSPKKRKRSRTRSPPRKEANKERKRSPIRNPIRNPIRCPNRSPSPYRPRKRRFRRRSFSSSRSRSVSPRRRPPRRPEVKKRKSFLEEIRDKLNEVPPTPILPPKNYCVQTVPQVPPPVPQVPPPVLQISPPVPQSYDENFFIGSITGDDKTDRGDIAAKLFTEKKLCLSDYLTISAKSEVKSSSPEQLQKKIKLISLCNDAIKLMGLRKGNRLTVVPSELSKPEIKHPSPLRNMISPEFKFTTRVKVDNEVDFFAEILYDNLLKMGVIGPESDLHGLIDTVAESLSTGAPINREITEKILIISLLGTRKPKSESKTKDEKEVGTQSVIKEMSSVGVQSEQMPGMLSSESVAYLTSAYLLGRENRPRQPF